MNKGLFLVLFFFSTAISLLTKPTAPESISDELFEQLLQDAPFDDQSSLASRQISCIPPEEILDILLRINAPEILQQDFYHRTNRLHVRNSINSPLFVYQKLYQNLFFTIDLFYNHMSNAFFTYKSPFICSYIALNNKDVINQLEEISTRFQRADIPQILSLFQNIKMQERKAGIMLQMGGTLPRWTFEIKTPIYYIEHNFFLTDQEIQQIENAEFFQQIDLGESGEEEVELFVRQHLVSDRVGLGDTKIQALYTVYDEPTTNVRIGSELIVPTAATFKRGLLGGSFCPLRGRPTFSIQQLFQLVMCANPNFDQARTLTTQFLVGALDQLTANLADTPLGNGGHWGISPLIELRSTINQHLMFHLQTGFEYFVPAYEDRFFITQKNPQDFRRNYNDPNQAEANLTFLNTQLINTLYPFVIKTRVQPGIILKATPAFEWRTARSTMLIGYDFWWQAEEKFTTLCAPKELINQLAICRAIMPRASQHKIFATWRTCFMPCTNYDVLLFLKADTTFAHAGIGRDITAALGVQISF